jgi:AcrR family transcriptional regulator
MFKYETVFKFKGGEIMTLKERKERDRDERRELILNAANEIIKEEGIDHLSVRKIANKIEYSPSIIYHYFKDKDDIISHLMKKSYKKITDA